VTIRGEHAALETILYARKRNVTKIVVGRPTHARWRDLLGPSFLDSLVRNAHEIDVHVISATEAEARGDRAERVPIMIAPATHYLGAACVVALSSGVAWTLFGRGELADVVMIHLLGVVLVAMHYGSGASAVAAVLAVVAVDVIFVPPYLSLAVSDLRHVTTFGVMFVVAIVISQLTKRIREQADEARRRESRTMSLYAISRELGQAGSDADHLVAAARHLREVFAVSSAVFLPAPDGVLRLVHGDIATKDLGVVDWVWTHQRTAGAGTDTLPLASALVVPLRGAGGRVGVLALVADPTSRLDDRALLETFAGIIGAALERTQLAAGARRAAAHVEAG